MDHERKACTLGWNVWQWIAALVVVCALVFIAVDTLRLRKQRQKDRRGREADQKRTLELIEQVEASEDDELLATLAQKLPLGYGADPERLVRAKEKTMGAYARLERAYADRQLIGMIGEGESGKSLEVYAKALAAWDQHQLSAEGRQMLAAERVRVADKFINALLWQARDGHAPALIKLRDVVSHGGDPYASNLYARLTGKSWQPPQDWNELVVRCVWRPGVTRWFYYQGVCRNRQDVRNQVAAVTGSSHGLLPHEHLVRTLMLLALVDESDTNQCEHGLVGQVTEVPRYRETLGDALYADLVRLAQELRPVAAEL